MEDAAAGKTRGSDEPAHVMADRADLEHATGVSTFYGKPVRLWQGGNQILAPVIELSKAQKRLVARGDAGGGGMQVRTVLAGSGNAKAGAASGSGSGPGACVASATAKAGAGGAGSAQTAGAVQVTSGGLAYSASAGEADFSDGFRADTADGTIRAAEGVLYLKQDPAQQNGATSRGTPVASLSGELDHVVATGRVELDKPGLKATGERLVYTVSDRTAVLTGDAKTPPKAVGLQGSTTGVALRLRSFCDGSDSVEVVGGPGQRAHTDARAGDAVKKQKGKQ
jgi:lipopolysaccharide export system protein LptA